MQTERIDQTHLYETSKAIAEAIRTGCPANITCETCNCPYGCMAMEIAHQVIASGYARTNKRAKKSTMQCNTMRAFVEELAKTIAVARGYGCNSQDCCAKCSCAKTVGCVPLDIAEYLIAAGYRKEGVA